MVDLINKMLTKYLINNFTILPHLSDLSEVTKFKISMSYSGALAWVHHLHDDFQKSCFT